MKSNLIGLSLKSPFLGINGKFRDIVSAAIRYTYRLHGEVSQFSYYTIVTSSLSAQLRQDSANR